MTDTPADTPGATLAIAGLCARLGGREVLRGIDLSVPPGKVCAVLGPSGSGKSTLLRCVAGLVKPAGGTIAVDGQDIIAVPPHRRGFAMVFQNYSLWPHLSVAGNVALPLRQRGLRGAALDGAVTEALRTVSLEEFADRPPGALSGGQKQRVAIARALALKPRLLLLDEPLSNLDRQLRQSLLRQLRALHRTHGHTTLYVTHDQQEALALGDTVAVLRDGALHAHAAPRDLLGAPADLWLAGFLGELNTLAVTACVADGDAWRVTLAGGAAVTLPPGPLAPGDVQTLAFRPEGAALTAPGGGHLDVAVTDHWPEGHGTLVECRAPGAPHPWRVLATVPPPGGQAGLRFTQPLFFKEAAP